MNLVCLDFFRDLMVHSFKLEALPQSNFTKGPDRSPAGTTGLLFLITSPHVASPWYSPSLAVRCSLTRSLLLLLFQLSFPPDPAWNQPPPEPHTRSSAMADPQGRKAFNVFLILSAVELLCRFLNFRSIMAPTRSSGPQLLGSPRAAAVLRKVSWFSKLVASLIFSSSFLFFYCEPRGVQASSAVVPKFFLCVFLYVEYAGEEPMEIYLLVGWLWVEGASYLVRLNDKILAVLAPSNAIILCNPGHYTFSLRWGFGLLRSWCL